MIWGIHIEGPFLNEETGYIGAHPVNSARAGDPDTMQRLLDAAGGLTKIVTLAPERDADARVTQLLVKQGIRVSAGHCNSTLDQLLTSIDAGLTPATVERVAREQYGMRRPGETVYPVEVASE